MSMEDRNAPTKSIALILGTLALILGVLVGLVVAGLLSPRSFAWGAVVAIGFCYYRLLNPLRRLRPDSGGIAPTTRSGAYRRYLFLAGGLVWLTFTFWLTRGGPWWPRLVGAAVFTLFLAGKVLPRR